MASRSATNLDKLWNHFDVVMNRLPDARRTALEAAGRALEKEVARQIDAQLPNHDDHGTVKRWQDVTMGSRGGYVSVAPKDETVRETKRRWFRSAKKYSSRQITYWLEKGHKMVLPKRNRYGRVNPYRADEDRTPYNWSGGFHVVPGYLFYSWADMEAQKLAEAAAKEVLELLANDLEDFAAGQISMEGWL